EASFVNELGDLPEGITKHTEVVSAGQSKPNVSSAYLVAKGKDEPAARKKLSEYIEKLKADGKVPEDHEFLVGDYDRAEPGEGKSGDHAARTFYLFGRAEVT